MAEGVPKVLKRPAGGKDRAIPVPRKRDENHTEMRKNRERGNGAKERRAERAHHRSGPARPGLARGLRHHGVRIAAERPLADCVKNNRRGEHDGDEREGKGIASDVVYAGENLHRGHAGELEHQGHAQFRKSPDEDDRPAGEEPWHDQRKRNPSEFSKTGASEVFRGLLHGGIEVREGGDDVEVENWVEMEGIHHDHAPKTALTQPVDRMVGAHQPGCLQQGVKRAFLPEDLFDADGADEWRQNHWHEDETGKKALAWEEEPVAEKGERKSEENRENSACDGEKEGVDQALEVDWVSEDLHDEGYGKGSFPCEERAAQCLADGPREEEKEEQAGQGEDKDGEGLGHGLISRV